MAGPSIAVRVLGDLTKFQSAFTQSSKTASSAASRIHGAFTSMLGTLNSSGVLGPFGESLANIDQAFDSINEHGKTLGKTMLAVGGAGVGVGLGLTALGSKDKAANQQLQAAIAATGQSYDDYSVKVDAAVKHQEKFGDTANQTEDALSALTEATGSPTKALGLLNTATDLAAAKHESLTTAAGQLGKAYNGNAKILKEFGLTALPTAAQATKALTSAQNAAARADTASAAAKQHLADLETIDAGKKKLTAAQAIALRNAEEKVTATSATAAAAHKKLAAAQDAARKAAGNQMTTMDQLGAKLKGQASAAADTFTGHLNSLKAKVEDAAASFGGKYGPAITTAAGITAGLGGAWETAAGISKTFRKATEDTSKALKDAEGATKAVQGAEEGATAASDILAGASGIGLVLLAVAALALIGYELAKHWNTIWAGMKAVVVDLWSWIKNNWPYILGFLLGPIALAAAAIYKNWANIKAGALVVYDWLQKTWPTIWTYIKKPFLDAWSWIVTLWPAITSHAQTVIDWFQKTWATVSAAIKKPFSDAWSWISGVWPDITGAAQGVINWFGKTWTSITADITGPISSAVATIKSAAGSISGFFTGVPSAISKALGTVADDISSPFTTAFSAIAGFWNRTVGTLSFHIPGWVPGVGGKGFSVPKLPTYQTGGLVPGTGAQLAILHGGEFVLSQKHLAALRSGPAPPAPVRTGPAIHVENVNLSNEMDVDLFLRKAAWAVKTRAV